MEYVNASGSARVVVCATRFTATCDSAVAVALELAGHSAARLVLVHVLESGGPSRVEAQRRLDETAARAPELHVDCFVLRGEPGHVIARTAQHERADVIVLGEGRPSDALIPNGVPEVLDRAGHCPTLSVALGESYADVIRRLEKTRLPGRHCLVCARAVDELICRTCQNQITAEALEGRQRVDKAAIRGISG